MKRQYHRPELLVERFELTQTLTNCSVQIGFTNEACVLKDADSSNRMKAFALKGYFAADACTKYVTTEDAGEDGYCFHTSVNLVFSS